MSKRMALMPPELFSAYYQQKPEIRLEDELSKLLDREKLPDDMKVKKLSQLVTRYQKTMHEPPEPVRVTVVDKEKEKNLMMGDISDVTEKATPDAMMMDIISSVPQSQSKFVPLIVEKLKTRSYFWNEFGEMEKNVSPIKDPGIVDFISYLIRNSKKQSEPKHFSHFLQALKEINIPHSWIANQKVLDRLKHFQVFASYGDNDTNEERFDEEHALRSSKSLTPTTSWKKIARAKVKLSPTKWINY
ncbi:hypothetical protein AVEN_197190-1 [Araneus ventricosus]|uniref:Uncharacterized protein n=1 Tax=Araneus ventricosus TaxID=182803 RepID=A0A4Y2N6C2_ARAVE|nr:hypothetical protein AVEN_197190-1 [Araneus ventricosus]